MEKKFLAGGLIITSVFILAFTSDGPHKKTVDNNTTIAGNDIPLPQEHKSTVVLSDTVPEGNVQEEEALNGTINSSLNGTKYKMVMKNDRIVELYVDGERVPAEKMAGYKTATDKIIVQSKYT